jgi:CrcB protein
VLLFLIALGGGAGAVARYLLGGWVQGWSGLGFPWGTLAVNLLGCTLLGVGMRTIDALLTSPEARGLIAVGFLGAFTTFSTFSMDTVVMLQRGEWERAVGYVAASVLFGLIGVWIGLSAAAWGVR